MNMTLHPYSHHLAEAAAANGDRIAVVDEEGEASYAELDRCASALASYLIDAGLARGERVAVVQKNGRRYMESVCAVARVGGVYVPMLGLLPDSDHDFIVNDSGAKLVICLDDRTSKRCARFLDEGRVSQVIAVGRGLGKPEPGVVDYDLATEGSRVPDARVEEAEAGAAAQILYTSGTTGKPKGVVHSRRAVEAAIRGWARWVSMCDGDAKVEADGARRRPQTTSGAFRPRSGARRSSTRRTVG